MDGNAVLEIEEYWIDYTEYLIWEAHEYQRINGFRKKKIPSKEYSKLLSFLQEIPFYFDTRVFSRDENRALDGLRLREDYLINELHINLSSDFGKAFLGKSTTVLEMLLALSFRCDLEYVGDGSGKEKSHLFWLMLENLGLLEFSNRKFRYEKVESILRNWLDRNYDAAGNGSIFPLKRKHFDPEKQQILEEIDQRNREIWDQMMPYLMENF